MKVDYTGMTKAGEATVRMAIYAAQMYYHLTYQMVQDYGEEAATKTIKKAMHEFGVERGKNIRAEVDEKGLEPTVQNLDKCYDMPIDDGWAPDRDREDVPDNYSRTDKCWYADFWMERNWHKIGRLYCEVDDAIREGFSEDLIYVPDKNIINGDGWCDSKTYYRSKMNK